MSCGTVRLSVFQFGGEFGATQRLKSHQQLRSPPFGGLKSLMVGEGRLCKRYRDISRQIPQIVLHPVRFECKSK